MDNKEWDQAFDELTHYLPAPLRNDWAVIPKRVIHKIAVASAFLGAAIALLIAGIALDAPGLVWGFPAVLVVLAFATRFVPWWREDRFLEQLRKVGRNARA